MKSLLRLFIISVFTLLLATPIFAQTNTGSLTLNIDDCVFDENGSWVYYHTLNVSPNTPIKINYTKETYDYFGIYTCDNEICDNFVDTELPTNGEQSVTIMSSTGMIYVYCEYKWMGMNNDPVFSLNYSIDPNYTISTQSVIQNDEYIGGKLGIGVTQPTEKLEVNGNAIIRNRLAVGSSSTSGNSIINGNLGIGTTNPTSKLHISNTTSLPGVGGARIDVTQTQANTTALSDGGLSVLYSLVAASATNELVNRAASIRSNNYMTGGGVVQNQRVLNLVSENCTGSRTTNLDMILLETGNSTGIGTTTNAYGLHIAALPGTNKWGIYDQSGSNWYTNGKVGIGDVAPEAKLSVVGNAAIGYASGQAAPENGMIVGGNVGIGTTTPSNLLDVRGLNNIISGGHDIAAFANVSGTAGIVNGWYANGTEVTGGWTRSINNLPYFLGTTSAPQAITILDSGFVGIGTTAPDKLFTVKGVIHAQEVQVDVTGFADYVFEKGYKLKPLSEIHSFISENGHLPEIPSADEAKKNGINVADMQVMLLKKIEELTLYAIEQQKRIEALEKTLKEK
ncbi:MAG: hypothetical protein VB110_07450 [Bacteroidales bacterium]|nr:hypothetical protein [Bacteroidales bacterium]